MARPTNKIAGAKFHRLTLIEPMERRTAGGNYRWLCQCDCGQLTVVDSGAIGRIKSCGCQRRESAWKRKLSDEDWIEIAESVFPAKELATRFEVSLEHIYHIKRQAKLWLQAKSQKRGCKTQR